MIYRTSGAAAARAGQLRRHGTWPGIVALPGGGWRLTFDPGEAA